MAWDTSTLGSVLALGTSNKDDMVFHMLSYWNKRELNQLLPQNNKGLKGHFKRFDKENDYKDGEVKDNEEDHNVEATGSYHQAVHYILHFIDICDYTESARQATSSSLLHISVITAICNLALMRGFWIQ